MTPALELTDLDRRVLAALREDLGRRAHVVAQHAIGAATTRCDTCGYMTYCDQQPADRAAWVREPRVTPCLKHYTDEDGFFECEGHRHSHLAVTDEQVREVREILRGLEAVGMARQVGDEWTRTGVQRVTT